jgi:hypothetical protein
MQTSTPDPSDMKDVEALHSESSRQADEALAARAAVRVPTREELSSMSPATLEPILFDWMWESPGEQVPSDEEVHQALHLLLTRPDAQDCAELIAECRAYLLVTE